MKYRWDIPHTPHKTSHVIKLPHLIFPTASKNGCPCQIKLTLCLLLLVHVTKSWFQHRSHLANSRPTTTSTTKATTTSITGSTSNNVWPRGGGGSVRLCIIFEWLTTTTTTTLPRPTWSKLNVVVEVEHDPSLLPLQHRQSQSPGKRFLFNLLLCFNKVLTSFFFRKFFLNFANLVTVRLLNLWK